MVMHHYEPDCLKKNWFAICKVKVTVKDNIIEICLFNILTADPFATKLGLMVYHLKMDCLVKRYDCCVMIKVKVTEKFKSYSECSSGGYLFSC